MVPDDPSVPGWGNDILPLLLVWGVCGLEIVTPTDGPSAFQDGADPKCPPLMGFTDPEFCITAHKILFAKKAINQRNIPLPSSCVKNRISRHIFYLKGGDSQQKTRVHQLCCHWANCDVKIKGNSRGYILHERIVACGWLQNRIYIKVICNKSSITDFISRLHVVNF